MNDPVRRVLDPLLEELAEGYLNILSEQEGSRKEFFGLRDFYRLEVYNPCCNGSILRVNANELICVML